MNFDDGQQTATRFCNVDGFVKSTDCSQMKLAFKLNDLTLK